MPLINVPNKELRDKHMSLVNDVNYATCSEYRYEANVRLSAWLDGLKDAGISIGHLLIDADLRQLDQGVDRPMCGGVFLDTENNE